MDDALAVYKELLKKYDNRKIAVFGTSTGGGMTLALVAACKGGATSTARRHRAKHALG